MSDVLFGWVIPVIHLLACVFLIVVVLLQTGKGADMGAVFGGGSQTLFGSGGAGNFLTRLTTATAIVFMATSLVLTYGKTPTTRCGILDKLPSPTVPDAVPLAPQAPAAGAGAPADAPVAAAPEAAQPAAETPPAAAPTAETPPPAPAAAPAKPAEPAKPLPPAKP